jgi:magnesium transporter
MKTRSGEAFFSDPVSRHVRRDVVRLRAGQTVGEALASMRQQPPAGRIIYFYVVGDDDRLEGVVPTRRLLLSAPETPVADIMVRQVVALPLEATVLDACEFFILHRLLAFPVVDGERRLVGVIDVDLYTDRFSQEGEGPDDTDLPRSDDLFQLIGVHLARTRQTSPVAAFRGRFPWLICNLTGGLLAAGLSWLFEADLQRVVALALFIPVVLALAESVSTQSVSLALQALHARPATWLALLPWVGRELLTGLLLGVACGVLVGGVAWLWLGQAAVAWALLGAAIGGVAGAAVLGIAIPNLLRLLALDPHVASGPVALALADMLTLLVYFNLAHWLLV